MADKVYAKHYSIGPSGKQVATLMILAAAGGAVAMYYVPQLPSLIMGLFKGTETPASVIAKAKASRQQPRPQTTRTYTGPQASSNLKSRYTYPTYRY